PSGCQFFQGDGGRGSDIARLEPGMPKLFAQRHGKTSGVRRGQQLVRTAARERFLLPAHPEGSFRQQSALTGHRSPGASMSAFPGGMTFPGEHFHQLTMSPFRPGGQYLVTWFLHAWEVLPSPRSLHVLTAGVYLI